ncbi:MAG TPA: helix-turn-helix domain-containing protein [Thermoplasmata archaeon]|nr:helix-turn-helix domain-containing protein [Thermoplasmata archaeon]
MQITYKFRLYPTPEHSQLCSQALQIFARATYCISFSNI